MELCGTCSFFKRTKLHTAIDKNESELSAGNCEMLHKVLAMDNAALRFTESLFVYDNFSCRLHHRISEKEG